MREEPRSSRNLHLGSSVPPYIKPSGLTPPAGGAMAQLPLLQGEFNLFIVINNYKINNHFKNPHTKVISGDILFDIYNALSNLILVVR